MKFLAITIALITAPLAAAAETDCEGAANSAYSVMVHRQIDGPLKPLASAVTMASPEVKSLLLAIIIDAYGWEIQPTKAGRDQAATEFASDIYETCIEALGEPA